MNLQKHFLHSNFAKIIFVSILATFGMLMLRTPKAYAAYDGARIIDNGVFLDAHTMNAVSIQQFLVDQGGGIVNLSFVLTCGAPTDTTTRQAYAAVSAPCGQTVPASTIIYYAAQIYGVNPRVILATMQKEQSLTTAANPADWQINQAMGYGCPDSGGCGASNFFYQIDNGTWALRYHYERANSNNTWWNNGVNICGGATIYRSAGLYAGATVTFKDEAGVGYRTYTLYNAATAAFYCYTPHAYNNHKNGAPNSTNPVGALCYNDSIHPEFGNIGYCYTGSFNFVYWYEKWFGTTIGALVRTVSNATVYLVDNGKKYPISDIGLLGDVWALGPIRYLSNAEISNYATAEPLTHMVGRTDGTLFFLNAGMKLPFTSCAQVAHYGYTCSQITYLSDGLLATLANAPYLTQVYKTTSGKTFFIENEVKREVADQPALTAYGNTEAANVLLESGINYLAYGVPLASDGTFVRSRQTGEALFVNQSAIASVSYTNKFSPFFANAATNGLDSESIQKMSRFTLTGFVQNVGATQFYMLTTLGKVQLATPSDWATSFTTFSNAALAVIPADTSGNTTGMLVKAGDNGTIYYVTSQKKRPIPSWNDLLGLNVVPLRVATMPDITINNLTTGATYYALGSMLKSASSATVYIVKSNTELFPISSFGIPIDFGLPLSVRTIPATDITAYSTLGVVQNKLRCGTQNIVANFGKQYTVADASLATYGWTSADFIAGGGLCTLTPSGGTLGTFLLASNGTIYAIQSGTKNPIGNFAKYLNLGGTPSNTTFVSDVTLSAIPTGALLF